MLAEDLKSLTGRTGREDLQEQIIILKGLNLSVIETDVKQDRNKSGEKN